MSSQAYTRLIGLKVYTLSAKYLGEVRDVGLKLEEGAPIVYMVIIGSSKSIGVPVSAIKAVGDIIILEEGYEEKILEIPEHREVSTENSRRHSEKTLSSHLVESVPKQVREQPLSKSTRSHTSILGNELMREKIVIPRCPRCRTALVYEPRKKRWYCPKCKEYVKIPQSIEARVPRCPSCGLPLSYIEQYGKWYCYNCRRYIDVGAGV